MKRIGFLLATGTAFVLCLAAPALAGGSALAPQVEGTSGNVGGTAFTGGNVSTSFLYLAAFVVAGALSIYLSRRRSLTTR
jgi:LPXTG cell wall anchor motif